MSRDENEQQAGNQKMAARIARKFDPEQIVLSGIACPGHRRAGQRVDLLVVMPVNGSKRQV